MVELESGERTSEKEQEERRLREEQTKEPNCNSDTVRAKDAQVQEPELSRGAGENEEPTNCLSVIV